MPSAIQFMHPGPEAGRAGLKVGKTLPPLSVDPPKPHRRKFLLARGFYMHTTSKRVRKARLQFWGE